VFDLTNVETLCRRCHEAHHADDAKNGVFGPKTRF
jgi:hypothetical protein